MSHPVWRKAALLALMLGLAGRADRATAQDAPLPKYLRDRGTGVPASLFGTYVERGQWLVEPFFAYSRDDNREYQPAKLGYGLNQDFRGRYRSTEELLFISYGLTDWLAVEVEGGAIRATLDKAPADPSATPARIRESGIGDFEVQLRLRLVREGNHRPEVFGFFEITPPSLKHRVLINEPRWDLRPGLGVIRGFSWGTVQLRITGEYNWEGKNPDLGEVAIEYLKRVAPSLRVNFSLEGGEGGAPDEFDLIAGVDWRIARGISLKLDNSVGLSSKATDWAPQAGLRFSFPR
jgi:hypothetical protein